MGSFSVECSIQSLTKGGQAVAIADVTVDTGSKYTWLPAEDLLRAGITIAKKDLAFLLANGTTITRDVGYAFVRLVPGQRGGGRGGGVRCSGGRRRSGPQGSRGVLTSGRTSRGWSGGCARQGAAQSLRKDDLSTAILERAASDHHVDAHPVAGRALLVSRPRCARTAFGIRAPYSVARRPLISNPWSAKLPCSGNRLSSPARRNAKGVEPVAAPQQRLIRRRVAAVL